MANQRKLNENDKAILDEQNKLIKKFAMVLQSLNIEQCEQKNVSYISNFTGLSRDSKGHILLFVLNNFYEDIFLVEVMTLGKDKDDNFSIKDIAKCSFILTEEKYIFIESLSVKKEYRNCKIGRILLQFIENFAIKHKISYISLLPVINIAKISNEKYFDKNLYFYLSQGYVKDTQMPDCLIKKNLIDEDIEYGFNMQTKKLKKTSKLFEPQNQNAYNQFEGSCFGATYILTDDYENHTYDPISDFSPFILKCDEKSTKELKKFLDDFEEKLKNNQFGN